MQALELLIPGQGLPESRAQTWGRSSSLLAWSAGLPVCLSGTQGGPQGPAFGPLLFIVYVNPITTSDHFCADDQLLCAIKMSFS